MEGALVNSESMQELHASNTAADCMSVPAPAEPADTGEQRRPALQVVNPALLEESCEDAPAPGQVLEALLFASDTPLSGGRLADLVGTSVGEIEQIIAELNEKYALGGASFRVQAIARGYQLMTLPAFAPWLARLDKQRGQSRLTGAALEVLAVVAYKQPIIRAEIEAIRGVSCGDTLNRLREMGLIKIVGRAEIVGRPLLYGTTRKFLDVFGLADLEELPPMEALTLRRAPRSAEAASAELRAAAGA